jgi:hypothetical protein
MLAMADWSLFCQPLTASTSTAEDSILRTSAQRFCKSTVVGRVAITSA